MQQERPAHIASGKRAEDKASEFLSKQGYDLIIRNYRYKRGEIDIIARKNEVLVFVEVKYRRNTYFGYPEEAVNSKKAEKLVETAENYIFETDWRGPIRFDIVSITGEDEILHFLDAF